MIPAIGDTLDGRYTLIAQYRSQPGLSAWIARDHALDLDCQIFLLTDQTRIGLVSQIASALVLSRDPRSTAVRRFHSVGDALLVVMEPDPGVALSTLVGKNRRLSVPAMRMVVNELIDTIQSLHSSQVDFHTLVPEVIRLTGSSLVLSAVPLDPYIEPPLVTRARQTSTGNEMLAILQISAILFKMLTGVTFDPHDMETMDQLLLQASYSAQLHGEGLPGDFLTILERALGVRLSSDESQQRPFPIYTLMEMQALLDNPLRPDKLSQEDLALPGKAGTSSATLVRLLPSAQQDLVDIPDSLVSTDTVHNEAGVILPWSRQELFAGTDVQEVDPSGLLGTMPSVSGAGAATGSVAGTDTGNDVSNDADVSGTGSAVPCSTTATTGSATSAPSAMTGAAAGAAAGVAAGAASAAGNSVTDDETRVFSPISVIGQPVGASGRPDSASSAYPSAPSAAQAGPQSASVSSPASARSAYISEEVNEEKAESTAHTQTVVNHHELSASDSSKFESREKKAAEKKENPHRLAQGIVIAVVAVAVLVGAIAAVHTLSGSINISLPWSSQEKDSDVGKHWNIDTSKAPLPGNAAQEEKEQAEDSADAKTGSSGSSSSTSSDSSGSAKSGTSTGTKSSKSSKSSTASTKRTRKRVTEHRTSKGVIIDDKNATAVPKPVQPITNPVQLAFTQRFFATSDGRGIAISLTKPHKISSVTITLRNQTSAGTGKLYVNSTASNPRNGKPVATFTFASGNQPTQITVSGAPTTQNLVIWIDNASQSGFYYSNLSVMGE